MAVWKLVVIDGDEEWHAFFFAGATLMDVACMAIEQAKSAGELAQIQHMRKTGFPNVTLFHEDSPPDVIEHYVKLQNDRNAFSAKRSFMEITLDAVEIGDKWTSDRRLQLKMIRQDGEPCSANAGDDDDVNAKNKVTEKDYRAFIVQHHKDKFESFEEFCDAKEGYKKLKKTDDTQEDAWQWWAKFCASHCIYTDASINNRVVIYMVNQIAKLPAKYPAHLSVAKALLKLCIPTNEGSPWIFRELADAKKIDKLFTPVKETKLFQASLKPTLANRCSALAVAAPKAGRGKAKAKAKQKAVADMVEALRADGTDACLIDDMLNAIGVAIESYKDPDSEYVEFNIGRCVIFFCEGKVTMQMPGEGEVTFDKWSRLRKSVKKCLVAHHLGYEPREDAVEDLEDPDMVEDEDAREEVPLEVDDIVTRVSEFFSKNVVRKQEEKAMTRSHAAFSSITLSLWRTLPEKLVAFFNGESADEPTDIEGGVDLVMTVLQRELFSALPDELVAFAASMYSEFEDRPDQIKVWKSFLKNLKPKGQGDLVALVFPDVTVICDFLKLRAVYVTFCFRVIAEIIGNESDSSRKMEKCFHDAAAFCLGARDELSAMDCAQRQAEKWKAFWTVVISEGSALASANPGEKKSTAEWARIENTFRTKLSRATVKDLKDEFKACSGGSEIERDIDHMGKDDLVKDLVQHKMKMAAIVEGKQFADYESKKMALIHKLTVGCHAGEEGHAAEAAHRAAEGATHGAHAGYTKLEPPKPSFNWEATIKAGMLHASLLFSAFSDSQDTWQDKGHDSLFSKTPGNLNARHKDVKSIWCNSWNADVKLFFIGRVTSEAIL